MIEAWVWVKYLILPKLQIPLFHFIDVNTELIYFLTKYSIYGRLNNFIYFSNHSLFSVNGELAMGICISILEPKLYIVIVIKTVVVLDI